MKSEVVFVIDGKRIPYRYDRSHLRLGTVICVSRNADGTPTRFSSEYHANSENYVVDWISPSQWLVTLISDYRVDDAVVDSIHAVVRENVSREVVERACLVAAKDIRLEHRYKTSEFERSRLHLILTVVQRLDLVRKIQAADVASALSYHYEPLIVYLMLTCFDRLGQPAEWLEFSSWLKAKKCADERQNAVNSLVISDPIEASRHLYRQWQDLYGVRMSFYRFLRDILPKESYLALLDSIRIDLATTPPNVQVREADNEYKEKWLLDLRNAYTHKAQFIPGAMIDHLPPEMDAYNRWHGRTQRIEATEWSTVSVFRWPNTLVSAVRAGLVSYMSQLAVEYSIDARN